MGKFKIELWYDWETYDAIYVTYSTLAANTCNYCVWLVPGTYQG